MMNWKKCKLGDVATTTTTKIGCSDITSNYISTENMLPNKGGVVAASSFPSTGNVSTYQQGDILVSNIRPYFKKIWRATCNGTASNDVIIFCANEGVDNLYLYYLLADDRFFAYVMTGAKGTKMPRGDKKQMLQYPVNLPPLEEQKRIADILGAFDDKIELLQKQNKTLEDMAKALFKSWFVDFDVVRAKQKGRPKADIMREYHLTEELYDLFPSSFADSPLGPIPSGWETSNLDSLCIRCQSGGTPSTKHAEYWENAVIDWFSTKELQDSFLLNSEKTISEEGLNNSSAKLFPKGTIIMAIYASPTVGRLGILTQEATFNQAAVGFIPKEDKISREYLFLMLKHRRDDLNNLANGAAQQNLSVGVVKAFNILIPNAALNTVYKRIVSPLFNKMEFNVKQIQTLTELRDTLLPRLISGKIRV